MPEALSPCPFCGEQAALQSSSSASGGFLVRCGKTGSVYEPQSGCGATTGLKQTRDDARKAWNQRSEAIP